MLHSAESLQVLQRLGQTRGRALEAGQRAELQRVLRDRELFVGEVVGQRLELGAGSFEQLRCLGEQSVRGKRLRRCAVRRGQSQRRCS